LTKKSSAKGLPKAKLARKITVNFYTDTTRKTKSSFLVIGCSYFTYDNILNIIIDSFDYELSIEVEADK
jgi:hypothetical protein